MKKLLTILGLLVFALMALTPAALGVSHTYSPYYDYGYSGTSYGPVPGYSVSNPVYRVTATVTQLSPTVYPTTPVYNPGTSFTGTRFTDVGPNHPYYTAIEFVGTNGIMGGFTDGTFRPDLFITRAQFVALIVKARGVNTSSPTYSNCYNDVGGDWYANEVCFAKINGWLPRYGTSFQPNASITGGDARHILEAAYGNYAYTFPTGFLTRGQAAHILYTAHQRFINTPQTVYTPTYIYPTTTGQQVVQYTTPTPTYGTTYYPTYATTGYPTYSTYTTPTVTTGSSYYRYDPYNNNYYNGRYYETPTYSNNYYNYDSNYSYNNNYPYGSSYSYARTPRYDSTWNVYVPAGYAGPWY
ncbi:hypothetical protein CO046_00835 [Candidatus Peregrinibacteria bacterium CG_4_9_14_0_2_um_filter_53_11]|nr:MAG: hypothetical protein CO046_00835 [Candidatus Peregrinibacteria bacterium CG_4_9_14_0_2_um_filter_53_11]